jgi:hypothetical protein
MAKTTPTLRNWIAEVGAIRKMFQQEDLDMDDCDLIDLCKEFRDVDEVIGYMKENQHRCLWREAKRSNPLRSGQEFEARQAREAKRKARIAEAKKQKADEEKKAKEDLKAAKKKKLEPKPFVSRPIHTWDSLKFSATGVPLEPKEEIPPPLPPPPPTQPRFTPNRFVWSPQHVDDSQTPAMSVEPKVESSDVVDEPPKSDAVQVESKGCQRKRTRRSKKQIDDENPFVHIPDATSGAGRELIRFEPRKDLVISDEMIVFEDIEIDGSKEGTEEVPCEVEIADAPSVIDQPVLPLPHPIYGFPGNGQPMPAMMSVPGMQAPGYWMFHPQYGWIPCVYRSY